MNEADVFNYSKRGEGDIMAHLAIYRKWRPMTFDDVVGQEHITRTLKNQIMSGTVGHAYLFCGTRGTGKTTCAKILSRAVNCTNPQNGNPCNECDVCRGIIDGSIMDVTEMDAASNNGVEDVRDIIEDINYVASNSKYTVYIIDEVHMLSTSAFNALLKTLEEPPENVIFILATTEAHKVPQTILSRCQRFDFKRIRNEEIVVRMKEIAYADGYDITDEAYRMLAVLAEGSMRDGLSVMERVIAATGNSVTEDDITNVLGISSLDSVFELTDAIAGGDAAETIAILDRVLAEGKELAQVAASMLSHLRSLMLAKLSPEPEKLIDTDSATLVRYRAQSEKMTFEKINHATSLLVNAVNDAKLAKSPRIIYELAFIKMARPDVDFTAESVADRLAVVENKVSIGGGTIQAVQSGVSSTELDGVLKRLEAVETAIKNGVTAVAEPKEKAEEPEPEKKTSARLYTPIPSDKLTFDYPTAALARNWEKTLDLMSKRDFPYAAVLKNCVVTFDADSVIVLVPEERYMFTHALAVEHVDEIRKMFSEVTGTQYGIKIVKRGEFDTQNIINPFSLPKTDKQTEEKPNVTAEDGAASKTPDEPKQENKFDEFFERFSNIIVDADKNMFAQTEEIKGGEQSSLDDEDEREEFLEENELPTEDEE